MFEVPDVGDDELRDRVVAGKLALRRATAGYLRHVAELEARGVCGREEGITTAAWVAWQTGEGHGAAQREVATAVKLRTHFGAVLDALHDGEISVDHVLTITRAANLRNIDGVAAIQKDLLGAAKEMRFPAWKRHTRYLADLLDQDGGHDPDKDAKVGVRLTENFDGTFDLNGTLSAADGLAFQTELDRLADHIFNNHQHDVADLGADHPNPFRIRSRCNAEAVAEMARRSAARNATDAKPPRPEVIVVWDLASGTATTADGSPIRPDVFQDLVSDAMWRAMWTDQGVPLKLGRTRRLASDAQRRALAVRDGGCIFPDCPRPPSHCRAHHAIHWDPDGDTDLDNLYLLCPTHHGLIHSAGWSVTVNPDQTLTFTTPTGRTINSQRHTRHTDLP